MNQLLHKWPKSLLVGLGAVVLSTVGIQASDMLSGVSSQFASSINSQDSICGNGAELILYGTHSVCMDIYEASPNTACTYDVPKSELETQVNVSKGSCATVSEKGKDPWRFVTYTEASQLCARGGKRLPTSSEWYKVAIGLTEVNNCITGVESKTGNNNCITPTGIHDLVGSVWEWTADTVTDGQFDGVGLPDSGYIKLVDARGVILETSDSPDPQFGDDYAWVDKTGTRGLLRGGFYGSGGDGGIFSQNIATPLSFSGTGVGFRCVQDVR